MKKRSNRKLFSLFTIITLVMALITLNIVYIVVMKTHLRSQTNIEAYSNGVSTKIDVLKANRGTIYDSKNNVLANDTVRYKIIANLNKERLTPGGKPAYVVDPKATAEALAPIIKEDSQTLYGFLTVPDVNQVELGLAGKNLSLEAKQKIEALKLPGIEFEETVARMYPEGIFASHLIGYARYHDDQKALVGEMGIESIYNEELTGKNGYKKYQASKGTSIVLPGSRVEIEEAHAGNDIYLTLDSTAQHLLEEAMSKTMTEKKASKVWGALMEVKTGKILAMGNYPSFNPELVDIQEYLNLNTRYLYEPGSTMKAFLYAAAIDAGVYPEGKTFDSRTFKMGIKNGEPIRVTGDNYSSLIDNASKKSWGQLTFDEGFMYSSNVAIAELLSNYLKTSTYREYLDKFGFFKEVGFDRYTEQAGMVQYNYPVEKINAGFGQGIYVTAIQMLQGYSAFFNDGVMVKPYIVQQIKNPITNEVKYLAKKTEVGQPVSAQTAQKVREIMDLVVNDDRGSGRFYRQEEFGVIGKTGTAQMYLNGTYNNGRVIASTMLAFPKENPQYLFYYAYEADYNTLLHFHTETVNNFIYQIAREYGVTNHQTDSAQPQGPYQEIKINTMPNLMNHTIDFAKPLLDSYQVEVVYLGTGNQVVDQYPIANEDIVSGQKVFLKTNQGEIVMPDMHGWSRKDVTAFWSLAQVSITMEGFGMVSNQNIVPGTIIYPDTEVVVTFN